MDYNDIRKLVNELGDFEQLKLHNIPDIDLYMDQVTTFVEEKLGYLKRNEKDNALTKTMINNYTKAGILMPPNKKKYSKQHMILIVLTYYLKQILSINDIQRLFSPIVKSINEGKNQDENLESIYNSFLQIESREVNDFIESLNKKLDEMEKNNHIEEKNEDKLVIIVIMLVVKSCIEKRMAEKIIDKFF